MGTLRRLALLAATLTIPLFGLHADAQPIPPRLTVSCRGVKADAAGRWEIRAGTHGALVTVTGNGNGQVLFDAKAHSVMIGDLIEGGKVVAHKWVACP